jgi:NAD(P)-dependent dehydrogenase (short-subunit alcohol dehydrogenase family)
VNAILPGNIQTKMMLEGLSEAEIEQRNALAANLVPQGRMGVPRDIADAVLFLLSDQSQHITGVQLPVDGGITAQVYPSYAPE